MSAIKYQNFDLRFGTIKSRQAWYSVHVLNSSVGETSNEFQFPFSDPELKNFPLCLGRIQRNMDKPDSPELASIEDLGKKLFDAVFTGQMQTTLQRSLDEAERHGQGLRIRLNITDAPLLIELPWEYLYDSFRDRFLALSKNTLIVRCLDSLQRVTPLAIKPPLNVLVMIASPSDQQKLDSDVEWRNIKDALADLEQRKLVTVTRLKKATLSELQRELRHDQYHIFHFVGHGGFDQQTEKGVLFVEDEKGSSRRVDGKHLDTLFHDYQSLRLVILNACEGAHTARTNPFAGIAQYLLQQGIPAVIAMQHAVTDETAISFSSEFYKALVDDFPVDAALGEARKTISTQENGNLEWGIPTLYMRSPDGYIFQISVKQDNQSLSFQKKNEKSGTRVYLTSSSWWQNKWLLISQKLQILRNFLISKKSFMQYFAQFLVIVLVASYVGSNVKGIWKQFVSSDLPYSQPEAIATPELNILPTSSQQKKANALTIWATELQNRYNPTGSLSHNNKIMSRRDIPEDVTCYIYAYLGSWWFQKNEEWQLICSDNNFTTKLTIQVNGIAARGLTGGDYRSRENPLTIYGTGPWPYRSYQPSIVSSQPLKENALAIWAAELQKIYNPRGMISDNTSVISKDDIPEGVACDVFSDSNGWWPKRYESWQLLCSNNDFKTTILIQVNGTAARGLTSGTFYSRDNPYTLYGAGSWPDTSYEPDISTVATPMPTTALTTTSILTNTSIITSLLAPTTTLAQTP